MPLRRRELLRNGLALVADAGLAGDAGSPAPIEPRGDGVTDDTRALADFVAHHVARGLRVVRLRANAVYLTDELAIPDDMECEGNGARIERRINRPYPLVTVGKRGAVRNLVVNGRMDVLGARGGGLRMTGIALDDHATAEDCESYQNARHNISNKSVVENLKYRGIRIIRCRVHHGGANPAADGSGDGDGINLTNVSDFLILDCESHDNGRSDMVVTTYDPAREGPDSNLTTGGRIDRLKAGGGAYAGAEVNFEYANGIKLTNSTLSGATVIFAHSDDVVVENVHAAAIYSTTGNRPTVLNCRITNASRSSDLLVLNGESPTVRNVEVSSTAVVKTGNAATVMPADRKGHVDNLRVDGANNGIRIDVDNFSRLSVTNARNVEIRIGRPGRSLNATSAQVPERRDGRTNLAGAD